MNPLHHPGALHRPILDVEKEAQQDTTLDPHETSSGSEGQEQNAHAEDSCPGTFKQRLAQWNRRVEGLVGLEARGISRVLPEEKHGGGTEGYVQMFALWFGMSMSALNIVLGFLGPLLFELGWVDSVCIVVFANALAACGPAYMATLGPRSGLRTMVLTRYFMGYWPAKLATLLNIIMQTGWGIITCIVVGQIISAVNGKGLSIAVGCVISALCIGGLTIFGIAVLHVFERYAAYVQAFAILILLGASGKDWNTSLRSSGDATTVTANRCSFFTVLFAAMSGFTAISADFYVYYPVQTSRRLTFFATWTGLITAVVFVDLVGVGIATGVAGYQPWAEAYAISTGALLKACYEGLGTFGSFCVVILALGCIQNNAPSTYVAALSIQTLGRYAKVVPRWVLCVFIVVVELVCSVAGRNNLYDIFENFLPIMAYWVLPWITIILEEHILFHVLRRVPFDWTIWEDPKKLPLGIAAMLAWSVGWAGAILGMAQVWYTGPIALLIGGNGGDIGAWLAIGFTGLVYPPLRYIELKKLGR